MLCRAGCRSALAAPRRCLTAVASRRHSSTAAAPTKEQLSAYTQQMVMPYAVFGIVDMSTMLLSADIIDSQIAPVFNVSALHSAAWGNTWGLLWGITAMNLVLPGAACFPAPPAGMTLEQLQTQSGKSAKFMGAAVGLIVGCIIGMFPLVWQYFGLYRLWPEGKASQYGSKMQTAGVDVGSFGAALLDYLKKNPEAQGKFKNLTPTLFKQLLEEAAPQHLGSADAVFAAMDVEGNGFIGFDDFFRALVCGPVMNDPRFAPCVWTAANYGIAQPMVDKDHQKLFALINNIVDGMKQANVAIVGEAIHGLRGYTDFHFNRELELLATIPSYPADEMTKHKQQHKDFVAKITEFETKFELQSLPAVCELVTGGMITYLQDWLVKHIQNTDKRCTPYYAKAGVGGGQAMTI